MKKVINDTTKLKIQDFIKKIQVDGHDRFISRVGKNTKELENVQVEVNPLEVLQGELTKSEEELLTKEKKIVMPIIQEKLYDAINLLLNDDSTRQALVYNGSLKNPVDEFPCLTLFHFLANGRELNLKVFVRSSDVQNNLYVDLWFLSEMLKEVAKNSSKKMGRINLFISSAHIYV